MPLDATHFFKPIAATNNLNFGNPERPEIMAQLVESIEGMAEACKFFDTPITGGNVSLYNETLGEGIYPTPVIGIVGLMKTAAPVTVPFKNVGRSVILLGGIGVCDETRFDKRLSGGLRMVRLFAGDGLFTAETKEPNWRKAHNILIPTFSLEAMKGYLPEDLLGRLRKNALVLIKGAAALGIPVLVSEQYKKGLGELLPELGQKVRRIQIERFQIDERRLGIVGAQVLNGRAEPLLQRRV